MLLLPVQCQCCGMQESLYSPCLPGLQLSPCSARSGQRCLGSVFVWPVLKNKAGDCRRDLRDLPRPLLAPVTSATAGGSPVSILADDQVLCFQARCPGLAVAPELILSLESERHRKAACSAFLSPTPRCKSFRLAQTNCAPSLCALHMCCRSLTNIRGSIPAVNSSH